MLDVARDLEEVRSVVLDMEIENLPSIQVAERVGATRGEPTRVEHDRHGGPRELAVVIVKV